MADVAGVKMKRDSSGRITEVTIDTIQHPQAVEWLQNEGLLEKASFGEEFEQALTLEEARQKTIEAIKSFPWKK
jgi:hypothetical protein